MKNRVTFTILGYVLLCIGFLSVILGAIGLRFGPLAFIDEGFSPIVSFTIKLCIIIAGVVMFYMSRIDPRDYE